jgi:carboxypeptidase PM20D1
MKLLRITGMSLAVLTVLLIGVVLIRTQMISRQQAVDIKLPPRIAVDPGLVAQHLSRALQFRTVSHQNKSEDDLKEWQNLREWLTTTYPKFHATAIREIVGDGALVYIWKGANPSLEPIILMAHQDVVPAEEETLTEWKAPPFSGAIREGAVWGRGAIDDKGSLVALMEAGELLITQGFQPERTVLLISGHDEEVSGSGALAAAQALKARGVHAQFVLDEGSCVIELQVNGKPAALIGVAEKGYGTLRITARATGGHSSYPPKDTGAATLARAVVAINDHGFPLQFKGPTVDMLKTLAPTLPFTVRMAIANEWLFEPILIAQIAAVPEGAAMLHTTTAPTMLSGSPKENVMPATSIARINYRIMPGDTTQAVMANAKAAVDKLPVEISWENESLNAEPSPISSTNSDAYKIIAALASDTSGAPAAPTLVMASTDSKFMNGIAKDVYRFWPIRLSNEDLKGIHGINEHISLQNLESMIQFYARLIKRTALPDLRLSWLKSIRDKTP